MVDILDYISIINTTLDNITKDLEDEINAIEQKWEFIKDPYKEISGLRKAIEIVNKYNPKITVGEK